MEHVVASVFSVPMILIFSQISSTSCKYTVLETSAAEIKTLHSLHLGGSVHIEMVV